MHNAHNSDGSGNQYRCFFIGIVQTVYRKTQIITYYAVRVKLNSNNEIQSRRLYTYTLYQASKI